MKLNSCGCTILWSHSGPSFWQLGLLWHGLMSWFWPQIFQSKPVCSVGWTCISCGCRILLSHPDPGIKSFSRIHFSVATLFIQKLHLTDPAPGTSHCYCIPGASAILTEPSGCDSWSGLKSKWCTQGGLVLASSLTDPPTEQSSCGSRGRGRVLIRLIASSESMAESHGRPKTDENGAQELSVDWKGLERSSVTRRTPAH